MDLMVRRAEFAQDRDRLVELHRRHLDARANHARFEWLYQDNPSGTARVWVLEAVSGDVVGAAAAFPRSVRVRGDRAVAWVLGDFCLSEEFRSLGPALKLQRACLDGVRDHADTLWYDFPSEGMLTIYKRLKLPVSAQMTRFAKPLKVDRKVQEAVASPVLQRTLSAVGNQVLALTHPRVRTSDALSFECYDGEYGDEFTSLAQEIGGSLGNCLERASAYLHWRYARNPLYPCECIVARERGRLRGYAMFSQTGPDALLLDVFAWNRREVVAGLVDQVVAITRARGCHVVNAPIITGHPWIPFFQEVGFQPREHHPVMMSQAAVDGGNGDNANGTPRLLLMQGDRDM